MTANSAPRAFIFDMDGTMVDNMAYHGIAWAEMLIARGVACSPADINRMAGMTNAEILRVLVDPAIDDETIRMISAAKEQLYRSRYQPYLKPVAGLIALLESARQAGVKIGVATSAPKDNIDFVLKGLALEALIDTVVGAGDIARGKPDPEIFLKTAAQLGIVPQHCIVFEDAPAGIEAARRAGMPVIALTTSLRRDELTDLPHVVRIVPDFAALDVGELLRLNRRVA